MSISATLITLDGAPPARSLVVALARESVTATEVPLAALEPVPGALLLALVGAETPPTLVARVASLRARADGRFGLLGVFPAGQTADAERALAAGFDDFVVGNVSAREIALRLRALARRLTRRKDERDQLTFGRIVVDRARHQVLVDGRAAPLTALELDVLSMLVEAGGRAVSRAVLLDRIWGTDNLDVGQRAVDNLMLRLRKKLGDGELIVTVRGHGFRLTS